MNEYLLLMRSDMPAAGREAGWDVYLQRLRGSGCFDGGSAIGGGCCVSRRGGAQPALSPVSGFLRVRAASLEEAVALLDGNPVYEAGGTVEVRELPPED